MFIITLFYHNFYLYAHIILISGISGLSCRLFTFFDMFTVYQLSFFSFIHSLIYSFIHTLIWSSSVDNVFTIHVGLVISCFKSYIEQISLEKESSFSRSKLISPNKNIFVVRWCNSFKKS